MRFAVIGAGNGGQAISGYLAMQGHEVRLYDRNPEKVCALKEKGGIVLQGRICGFGRLDCITTSFEEVMKGADVVMVTSVANAHASIAKSIAPFIEENQVVVLNPGRTCGALVFKQVLKSCGVTARYFLGEAQTLVYACRIVETGVVNVIGVKDEVLLAGLPAADTDAILDKLNVAYPCFKRADNVLRTSLENIGAIFHPCVCLFNAATIERQSQFWFYRDMTEQVAGFIEKFDAERLAVGRAYGMNLIGVTDWIKFAYQNTEGNTLCELMRNNPAYHDIKAPGSIFTRQLTEDIPTGVLPIIELGKIVGVATPLMESMVVTIGALLNVDFYTEGRTLESLGLEGKTKEELLNYVCFEK